MTAKHISTLFCLCLIGFTGMAQLSPGTFMLGGEAVFTRTIPDLGIDYNIFRATPIVGYMVDERIMVGGTADIFTAKASGAESASAWEVSVFGRYYLSEAESPNKWFLAAGLGLGRDGLSPSSIDGSSGTLFDGWIGGGMDRFLSSDVSMSGFVQAGFSRRSLGGIVDVGSVIRASYEPRAFVSFGMDKADWDSPLAKGNRYIGGMRMSFDYEGRGQSVPGGGQSVINLLIAPRRGYFLSDRFVLGTGLQIGLSLISSQPSFSNTSLSYGVSPFARYYFNDAAFAWFGELEARYDGSSLFNSFNADMNFTQHTGSLTLWGGANYFLSSNVALEGRLGYSRATTTTNLNDDFIPLSNLAVSVGLQFFLRESSEEE